MVRVCASEGCKTSARFNNVGEPKGKFCSRHKEPGMIDIVHPHCKIEGCATLASFNMPGESRGEYCSQHKLEGMVNVKHRRCAEAGCNTRPAFNWKGEEKGAFCNKHKEKGMVNVDKKDARAEGTPGVPGASAEHPRKRAKASVQPVPHEMQQHPQPDGFDHTRLAQMPDLAAALATGDANGYMTMQHALHYGHLPPEFAAANALGVNVPVAMDPSQRLPQEQLAHQMDARNAHSGVPGVADMSQAAWSVAVQEQQRAEQEQQQQQRSAQEGGQQQQQQLPQHHVGLQQALEQQQQQQQPAHLAQHMAQHGQADDSEPQQQQQMHQHMAQSMEQQQADLQQQQQQQVPRHLQQQDAGEYVDQHASESNLPSAEELRERAALGQTGTAEAAAAPTGSLGHLMLVQLIKYVRETLETQMVSDEGRQQLIMYTDQFSHWPEEKRVEEYAMLHFCWAVGRENRQQAVMQRVEKVLAV